MYRVSNEYLEYILANERSVYTPLELLLAKALLEMRTNEKHLDTWLPVFRPTAESLATLQMEDVLDVLPHHIYADSPLAASIQRVLARKLAGWLTSEALEHADDIKKVRFRLADSPEHLSGEPESEWDQMREALGLARKWMWANSATHLITEEVKRDMKRVDVIISRWGVDPEPKSKG